MQVAWQDCSGDVLGHGHIVAATFGTRPSGCKQNHDPDGWNLDWVRLGASGPTWVSGQQWVSEASLPLTC